MILVYGAIAGAVIIGSMILSLAVAGTEENMPMLEWVGYLIMIVALSIIFVGIKKYRDQELGGVIKFGSAFWVGLGITAVASLVYVLAWEVNLSVTDYAFIDDYTQSVLDAREAEGVTDEALTEVRLEMEQLKERYQKPLFRLPMTFMEIFPVGLLITIISAAILRNSKVLPAAA